MNPARTNPGRTKADQRIAVLCRDAADSDRLRAEFLQAHFRHIESVLAELALAGPLYDDEGARTEGSLFILNTGSLERAKQIVEADPYFGAGVWRSVEYRPFLPAAGDFVGGKTW